MLKSITGILSINRQYLLLILSITLFSNIALAQQGNSVTISLKKNVSSVSLDGTWHFAPATGDLQPTNASAESIDKKAKEIVLSNTQNWFSLQAPQFLNRISWWLPDVSVEYEKQEMARVASFPFDAAALQAGWYSKTIELPISFNAKKNNIAAVFEGVATISRAYCNGKYVGGHLGMFGSFTCPLTPSLVPGKNDLMVYVERGVVAEKGNEIVSVAVTVPVTRDMLSSLNSGMFGGFGNGPRAKFMGIWQPVKLHISSAKGQIDDVFFNPNLTGHHLQVTIDGNTEKNVSATLSYTIKNKRTAACW